MTDKVGRMLAAAEEIGFSKEEMVSRAKRWVSGNAGDRTSNCPWGTLWDCIDHFPLCMAVFPNLEMLESGIPGCPCCQYTVRYVTKIAKKVVRELEEAE